MDLPHSKTISFNIGESDRFRKVINLERTVGPDHFPPNRNMMIGGELLDLNLKSYQTKTTKDIMYEAEVFDLVLHRYFATIKACPLTNILVSSLNVPVYVLGEKDRLKHLEQGGKKDANFILEVFKTYLKQYDEKKSHTDLVLFDGASNVHKSGKLLAVYYPQRTVLNSSEHVLYPFFSKIDKLPVIMVRQRYSYKYILVPYKHTFIHNTSNLEHLVTVGYNTEVQAHVLRLRGFLSCSTRSILPPLKDGKERARPWIAPRNRRLLCRLILQHSSLPLVQADLES